MTRTWLILVLAARATIARDRIAFIDFYGVKGMDTEAVRRALPVHEGDRITKETDRTISETVTRVTGHEPTKISYVCCDPKGDSYIFIGLPGESSKARSRRWYTPAATRTTMCATTRPARWACC